MTDPAQTIEVYHSLFAVARQLRKLAHQSAADLGLTVHQIGILNSLLQHPGQSQKELTERLVFAKSRVSLHIDALAEKELVTRVPSEADRRETKLNLTTAGEALCKQYNEDAYSYKMLGAALDHFSGEEVQSLILMHTQLLAQLTRSQESDPSLSAKENNL
jgi:DNA-binding MarR family transcriptional regulator